MPVVICPKCRRAIDLFSSEMQLPSITCSRCETEFCPTVPGPTTLAPGLPPVTVEPEEPPAPAWHEITTSRLVVAVLAVWLVAVVAAPTVTQEISFTLVAGLLILALHVFNYHRGRS